MNIRATFSCRRECAFETFNHLLSQARRNSWTAALLSAKSSLDDFSNQLPHLKANRKFTGTQVIPLDQITGSVGRPGDFDRSFRPLKKHLANRWVANYLFLEDGNWPSIQVYKVGSQYFVEDGHHRVSVARSRGMSYIQAEVWEYELKECPVATPANPRGAKESARLLECGCAAIPCPDF